MLLTRANLSLGSWRFLQRTSPPREDSEAEDSHAEEEEVAAPRTPVAKPAPKPWPWPWPWP